MHSEQPERWTRRAFLRGTTLAEPPPETTQIKLLYRSCDSCHGLLFLAQEALHQEGFTEVQYVVKATVAEYSQALASGEGVTGRRDR
jgi:hypothetical protein